MIPVQTLETFDIFGDPSSQVSPAPAKYAQGYLPGEVLPAQHENFFLGKSSRCVTQLRDGLSSVENELVNIVTAGGATPDASTNNQVLAAINYLIAAAEARAKLEAHPKGELWWTCEPPTITVEGVEQPNPEGDPQLLFGGGTWVRIKDTFVWAAGDSDTVTKNVYTVEEGSFTSLIGTNNLPAHTHALGEATGASYAKLGSSSSPTSTTSFSTVSGGSASFDVKKNNYGGANAYAVSGCSGSDGSNRETTTSSGTKYNATRITLDAHSHTVYQASHTHSLPANTGNNTTSATALSVKNPLLKRYCWQRTA